MEPLARGSALLVEDHTATRDLIARLLQASGIEVLAVDSAERVLIEVPGQYGSFDVVILDIHLPGMTGLELASLIQARRPGQPIIMITGDADPVLAREALARGSVKFLLKPLEMVDLQNAVEEALAIGIALRTAAPARDRGWLDLVETSYMGSGHARRVGRIALALAESLPGIEHRLEVGDLLVAAWSHELGRDAGPDAVAVAIEGARTLARLGSGPGAVEAVRHLAERYDGSGGPSGVSGDAIPLISQIVAVADALEHAIVAGLTEGAGPVEAVEHAMNAAREQRGAAFRPDVVDAVRRLRERLVAICADSPVVGPTSRSSAA